MSFKRYVNPPEMMIDEKKEYTANVHTNKGDFKINLFADLAPRTVNNFVFLAREGFYNNISFHRIIESFMIQGGCPVGNGTGGPGYMFPDELPPVKEYKPGIVAMANSGRNTNGSQFFICTGTDSTMLNRQPNYTVFGEVVDGMDTVKIIAGAKVGSSDFGEESKPLENIFIESIEIEEK